MFAVHVAKVTLAWPKSPAENPAGEAGVAAVTCVAIVMGPGRMSFPVCETAIRQARHPDPRSPAARAVNGPRDARRDGWTLAGQVARACPARLRWKPQGRFLGGGVAVMRPRYPTKSGGTPVAPLAGRMSRSSAPAQSRAYGRVRSGEQP